MSEPGAVGWALFRWIIAFTVICSVILVLRFWAARITKRKFFMDDAFVIVAFVATLGFEGTLIWTIFNGIGKPSQTVPHEEQVVQAMAFALPAAMLWLTGSVCLKLSMLSLYLRIFSRPQYKKWIYIFMAITAGYGVSFLIVFPTNCIPVYNLWHPVEGGHCKDVTIEEFSSIAINLVIDLAIICLPMPALWGLKMPTRNKIGLTVMFGIGLITIAIMAWRLQITADSTKTTDFFLHLPDIGLVSGLELWLGIIVTCLPTLAPLFQAYLKPLFVRLNLTSASNRSKGSNVQLKSFADNYQRKKYYNIEGGQDSLEGYTPDGQANLVGNAITTECAYEPNGRPLESLAEMGKIHVRQDVKMAPSQ